MCDYSGKLISWLDRELGDEQMAEVQRHIQECLECRTRLSKYEEVSKAFAVYCNAAMAVGLRRRQPRWAPVLSAAAAVALAATLGAVMLRPRIEPAVPAAPRAAVVARPFVVSEPTPTAGKPARRLHTASHVRSQTTNWLPPEPAIQIAIPAEAMFPPGAIPQGVSFTADVSIGADGSAQQVRLRPRLVEFERRIN
jgi:Putative zinc-finger